MFTGAEKCYLKTSKFWFGAEQSYHGNPLFSLKKAKSENSLINMIFISIMERFSEQNLKIPRK